MSSSTLKKTDLSWGWRVWRQWLLANTVAEVVGLGSTLLLGILLFARAEHTLGVLPTAILGILAGTFLEGSLVGTAQWLVLRHSFLQMRWLNWTLATTLGAGIAWTLGMLPSILLFAAPESPGAAPDEINDMTTYVLAATTGIVLGTILGASQWLALRFYVPKAVWWIPANALAWMLGMDIVFLGMSFISAETMNMLVVLILILSLIGAGIVVGAIHGWVLVWLLYTRENP